MGKEEEMIRDLLDDLTYYDTSWNGLLKDEFMTLLKMKWEGELERCHI